MKSNAMLSMVIPAAQASQRQFPVVPASISLAQFGLESAWGTKLTGLFNPFGIKAVPGQSFKLCPTHEFQGGRYILIDAPFRNFESWDDAFIEHASLLASNPVYRNFRGLTAVQAKCQALTHTYATDPNYGTNLWKIIQEDDLTVYDLPAPAAPSAP